MNKKRYVVGLPSRFVLPFLLGSSVYSPDKTKGLGPSAFRSGTDAIPLPWGFPCSPRSARRVSTGLSLLLFAAAIKHMLSFKHMILALKSIGPKSVPKLNAVLNPAGV